MSRNRELNRVPEGNHIATVIWSQSCGGLSRLRVAEATTIKVDSRWVYVYLEDGEEVVKLSRTRNTSAQVYLGITLADVFRERIVNEVENSSRCCYGQFGWRRPSGHISGDGGRQKRCKVHTEQWLLRQIKRQIAAIETDKQWAARLAFAAKQRDAQTDAIAQGLATWRKFDGEWVVCVEGHEPGDLVTVRTRAGLKSEVTLGRRLAEDLFTPGETVRVVA